MRDRMTYVCNDCGEGFDDPETREDKEIIDYGIGSRWATVSEYQCCPWCGGEDFRELTADELEEGIS